MSRARRPDSPGPQRALSRTTRRGSIAGRRGAAALISSGWDQAEEGRFNLAGGRDVLGWEGDE